MRRIFQKATGTSRSLSRGFVTKATTNEIAVSESVSADTLAKMNPRTTKWIAIDVVSREKISAIVKTSTASDELWGSFSTAANGSSPAPKDAKAFSSCKNAKALAVAYGEATAHARRLKAQIDALELESFGYKDIIKLGLSAFKQAAIDQSKVKLEGVLKQKKTAEDELRSIGKSVFSTDLFNELINAMRIIGESNPEGKRLATQMLDDMTVLGIPFDDTTKLLLNNVVFGDGPLDDSSLLFSFVEYPERGEISISSEPLETIATNTLKVIASRHQTPLDEGRRLELADTHPCLQRSPE